MNDRLSFVIYLETAGPGSAAKRMHRHFGPSAVETARARWSGRLLGPQTTANDVKAALGAPDYQDDLTMGYCLPTRPGYLYTFDFDSPTRHLRASGFKRIKAILYPPNGISDPARLPYKLAEIGATADEVRSWIGAPARVYGWWPIETWEYSGGLVLQLRHGVVEDTD